MKLVILLNEEELAGWVLGALKLVDISKAYDRGGVGLFKSFDVYTLLSLPYCEVSDVDCYNSSI